EDLWAFNNEELARAIANCPIPVVSAVGHEVDFTIADFVADVRAPTPSGAAEIVVPDQEDWLQSVNRLARRIARLGERAVEARAQTLDFLTRRLGSSVQRQVMYYRQQVQYIHQTLLQQSPAARVQRSIGSLESLRQRLAVCGRNAVGRLQHRLQLAARGLDAVSPLATLDRGYAIVMDAKTGSVISDASKVEIGSEIRARLHKGELIATVGARHPDDSVGARHAGDKD
ncbi:MAG: exodeoxyribonuclease VII large subunit, partial [Woeseiaceae bacterium]